MGVRGQDGDEQQRRPTRDSQSQCGVDDGDVLDGVRQESGHRTWWRNRGDPFGGDHGTIQGLLGHSGPLRKSGRFRGMTQASLAHD
ncbi:hypothetical protein GCM10010287_25380 [Streptomyces variabilis]|uniref:Uncharacterized protein n=1 Tax=Streptomyces variabilis TaxID=67372 RepID=A0ABQ2TZR9_9ACTN|nr:hypothetical protein GCM10010265_48450 [Streptomyces griseoincarnatus]GGT50406.1 hypothetical protein GCM10010287_25380 [Streptomyces variabilis]